MQRHGLAADTAKAAAGGAKAVEQCCPRRQALTGAPFRPSLRVIPSKQDSPSPSFSSVVILALTTGISRMERDMQTLRFPAVVVALIPTDMALVDDGGRPHALTDSRRIQHVPRGSS